MSTVISIQGLSKVYASGLQALKAVDLEIRKGEIFALLGPNGAGKTTLISIVCGIVRSTAGRVLVEGRDIVTDYRETRSKIGLVPQELHTDMFETPMRTTAFSRGLFVLAPNPAHLEKVLRDLTLWEKRADRIMTEAFDKVYTVSVKYNISLRIAAYVVAIDKVAQTYKYRGGY